MATRIPIPLLTADKPYPRFKQELEVWKSVTDLKPESQAAVVALSLPETGLKLNIRDKVFDEIYDKLSKADGMKTLVEFLDKHLGKDELTEAHEKYVKFKYYSRKEGESMEEFISTFDSLHNKLAKSDYAMPSPLLCFELIDSAGISTEKQMFVKSDIDFTKKDTMYAQAQKALKKYFSDLSLNDSESSSSQNVSGHDIKPEVLYASNSRGRRSRGRGNAFRSRGMSSASHSNWSSNRRGKLNPTGPHGSPRRCRNCGSYRHFEKDCQHKDDEEGYLVDDEESYDDYFDEQFDGEDAPEEVVLFTQSHEDIILLASECSSHALLDTCCTSTVAGNLWLNDYIEANDLSHDEIYVGPSSRRFKFGNDGTLPSIGKYKIPANIAGEDVKIITDVVSSSIPLLLSKPSMKKAKMSINLEHDQAIMKGKSVPLLETSAGHYALLLKPEKESSVLVSSLEEPDASSRKKSFIKLHQQFGHASRDKIRQLLIDAKAWNSSYLSDLTEVCEKCEVCRKFQKPPPRPIVAMPMSKDFNELVAMDLKVLENGYILHIIDTFTRFSVSVKINRKLPDVIVNAMMLKWVSVFGKMSAILTDNGGEFSSDMSREVASILDVTLYTTAGDTPYQNGLCERVHGVVDSTLKKLQADCPGTDINVLLAWANMAKNSLQMVHGFSPYQLVFGRNPNLPNVITDNIPSLNELVTVSSPSLRKHLNVLHKARQAFISSEACEKIKRAFRSKVRSSMQNFQVGDLVDYHNMKGGWLGPAKVLAQDGKLIFVRHGGQLLRIPPTRLRKRSVPDNLQKIHPQSSNIAPVKTADKHVPGSHKEHTSTVHDEASDDEYLEIQSRPPADTEEKIAEPDRRGRRRRKQEDRDPARDVAPLGTRRSLRSFNKETGASVYSCEGRELSVIPQTSNDESSRTVVSDESSQNTDNNESVMVTFLTPEECKLPEAVVAKKTEVDKLANFNAYQIVSDTGQKRVSTRFVMTKKNNEFRARLVARGYEEQDSIQSDSPTVSKQSIRICLIIAASKQWSVETTDIKRAFLQSRPLDRDVFVQPPSIAECPQGKLWKLNCSLYGLTDAAREFYLSIKEELITLGCKMSTIDNSLFYKLDNGELIGLLATHIDDFLHCGNDLFSETVIKPLCRRFQAGSHDIHNFIYTGIQIKQDQEGLSMNQDHYIEETEEIECTRTNTELNSSEKSLLRSIVGAINWIVQGTRPDGCFEMLALSTRFNSATSDDLKSANKLLKKMKQLSSMIKVPQLNSDIWYLVLFADASFANLPDGVSSTSAHVIFLVDNERHCCPIEWRGCKIKRVVKSTQAAETLAFQEGIEAVIVIMQVIAELLPNKTLKILAKTDKKGLVESLNSTKQVTERVLRINIASIKQFVEEHNIGVQWIPADFMLADCMTKRGASGEHLLEVFRSGKLSRCYLLD